MTSLFTQLFRKRISEGASIEEGLVSLREADASPIDTIKAIREVLKTDLGTAKQTFCESPAWKEAVTNARPLHEELHAAVLADQEKQPNRVPETD